MRVFVFVERGVGDAMGVVNVGVRGGSSGIIGRHVLMMWLVGGVSSE